MVEFSKKIVVDRRQMNDTGNDKELQEFVEFLGIPNSKSSMSHFLGVPGIP